MRNRIGNKIIITILSLSLAFSSCVKHIPPNNCEDRFTAKYFLDTYFSRNIYKIEMSVLLDAPGKVDSQIVNGSAANTQLYKDSLDITESIAAAVPGLDPIQFFWKLSDKRDSSYMVTKAYNAKKPTSEKPWYGHPVPLSDYFGLSQDHHGVGIEYWVRRNNDQNFEIKNTSAVESVIEYTYNDNTEQVTLAPGSTFYFRTFDEHFFFSAINTTVYPDQSNLTGEEYVEFDEKLKVYGAIVNEIQIKIVKEKMCESGRSSLIQ